MFGNSNGQIKLCAKQKFKFLSATLYNLGIPDFRLIWPCSVVEVHVTRVKLRESSGYYILINHTFTFSQQMFLVDSTALWPSVNSWPINFQMRQYVHLNGYHILLEGKQCQYHEATTLVLRTKVGIFPHFNCFSRMPQTNTHPAQSARAVEYTNCISAVG